MARLVTSLIFYSLILHSLLSGAVAARVGNKPPEDPEVSLPQEVIPNAARPEGAPAGHKAPFSEGKQTLTIYYRLLHKHVTKILTLSQESGGDDGPDLSNLADSISSLIEDIVSLAQNTTSANSPALSTVSVHTTLGNPTPSTAVITTATINATLACDIYQSYTAICPAPKSTPYTFTLLGTHTVDSSAASEDAVTARASCLCYSASYYVPQVYDDAAWICAGASENPKLAGAANLAAQTDSFCSSIGNVRHAVEATFGQFTPTATLAPAPAASSPVNGKTGAGSRLLGAERLMWAGVVLGMAVGVTV
jgi:hypothetical protein